MTDEEIKQDRGYIESKKLTVAGFALAAQKRWPAALDALDAAMRARECLSETASRLASEKAEMVIEVARLWRGLEAIRESIICRTRTAGIVAQVDNLLAGREWNQRGVK